MTRTCSLAEYGPPEAGCQSWPTSYRSQVHSSLTQTSTPLSVQWHPVETPLTDHEGVSMPSPSCRRTHVRLPPSPPSHVPHRTVLSESHVTCLLPGISIKSLHLWSHHLLSHTMGFTMVDPPGVVRCKSILHKMFTHFHLVYPSPLAALPNALFKKASVLFIHSMV